MLFMSSSTSFSALLASRVMYAPVTTVNPNPAAICARCESAPARALPDFRDGPSNRPGADVRERAREHPQPAPRHVRPQPDGGQAVEVVAERERQQRGEAEEAHDSERIFADCSIDGGEFGVPVGDVLDPVPERVSRDEETMRSPPRSPRRSPSRFPARARR